MTPLRRSPRRGLSWCLAALALALIATPAAAQRTKEGRDALDSLTFARPELHPVVRHLGIAEARAEAGSGATFEAFDAFLTRSGGQWTPIFDSASGTLAMVEGSGIPWIPGTANTLRGSDIGLPEMATGGEVPLQFAASRSLDFVRENPGLFGADPEDLRLNTAASGPVADYLYFIDFQWTRGGIPVEGARVIFRLNSGNLVQFGQNGIARTISHLDTTPSINADTAWDILWGFVGGRTGADRPAGPGRLLIVPAQSAAALSGQPYPAGEGVAFRLVYILGFHRDGVMGNWEARVDAHTGEVLSFVDHNDYGAVTGGIYPVSSLDAEVERPLPYLNVDNGGIKTTDSGGNYTFGGGTATAGLTGQYINVADDCGISSLSTSTAPGNLAFGQSTGTDCTTPPAGGPGNTHSARSSYYHLNLAMAKGRAWLPTNTWLQAQLNDRVNLQQTCNGYWDGSQVNFFRSGGGCNNTGELAGVFLHEFGHGLDSNDGLAPTDHGTGEYYGDSIAFLLTHDSCIGTGFRNAACSGYGDACTSCTGVREVDYAKHAANTPYNPLNWNYNVCPEAPNYQGPCGWEGHCEALTGDQASWDLATRDLPSAGFDSATSWQILDRLFYLSRATAGMYFTCYSGGQGGGDGCAAQNWFSAFRVVDDNDGNLANGTPHAAAIYAAFHRHGIACESVTNTNSTTCPAVGKPSLTATGQSGQVALSWTAASGATSYLVLRNEFGTTAGYTIISQQNATSYNDTSVAPGITYYYTVQGQATSGACTGPLAAPQSATPTAGGTCAVSCTATVPSTGTAGAAVSFSSAATPSGCSGSPSYAWNFGDGGTSTQQSPSHTYAAAGSYSWSITVTVDGQTCSKSGSITITGGGGGRKAGDCDGNGTVSITELQQVVNNQLGISSTGCGDCDGNAQVSITELQKVVNCQLGMGNCDTACQH